MQVSVESTSTLGRRLTISVPPEKVQSEIQNRMASLSRTVREDGFRRGKVPPHILQKKYGAQVQQEAIGKLIETSLPMALEEQALKPAGRPVVEKIDNGANKALQYIVSFEVFPELTLPDFSKIEVEKYQVTVTEADIDKTCERLRNQFATWTPIERPAKIGDQLTLDYTSTLNGKPYENSHGQDVIVELGTGLFIEGFEQGLVGATVGEKRTLELEFPADWRLEKLAGKPVQFIITVKAASEKHLAAFDEAFAKKIAAQGTDLQAIRQKVRADMEKQADYLSEERCKEALLDKLYETNAIPLPRALIESEMSALHEDMHRRMGDKAHDSCHHQGLEEQARRRVSLSLFLRKVIESENLSSDKERIKNKIAEISKAYGNAEFIESMYYESEELYAGIQNAVLVDQAIDSIIGQVSIVSKPSTFDDLINRSN